MPVKFKKIHQGKIPFSKFGFKKLVALVENFSLEVVLEAQAHHRFISRSNNAERSVRSTINTQSKSITAIFDLNDNISNYSKYLHNGFRHPNPGWKPDPFLKNAFEMKLKNLRQLIKTKMDRLK